MSYLLPQSPQHISLNRRAAAAGICLYKNANKILPLKAEMYTKPGSLLVAGPTAPDGDNLQGNYASHTDIGAVSILEGIQNVVGSSAAVYQPGCQTVECTNKTGFPAAVAAAQAAAVTVLVLGTQHDCSDLVACEGEGHDRTSIEFAGLQRALAVTLATTGTPLICVLVHGGSMALSNLLEFCDAIVDAWFPGAQGGNGLAGINYDLHSSLQPFFI